jgi:hypothetical protein
VVDGFVHSEKPAETMSFLGVINLVLASSSEFKSILVCDRRRQIVPLNLSVNITDYTGSHPGRCKFV